MRNQYIAPAIKVYSIKSDRSLLQASANGTTIMNGEANGSYDVLSRGFSFELEDIEAGEDEEDDWEDEFDEEFE